jgi:DNA helicase-2/ATP-dependent DNA helicase PcrA
MINKLKIGDEVCCYRNGSNTLQTITNTHPSKEVSFLHFKTAGGKEIQLPPTQKLWASLPVFEVGSTNTIVYLMYRDGFGYRVGITNKSYSADSSKNLSSRLNQEQGSKLWILDICVNRKEALYKELEYSLNYGVPTCVFNGVGRGLDQNHIDKVFYNFGCNGLNVLKDKRIDNSLPHWNNYSATKGRTIRNIITLVEHSNKGSQVCLEWSEGYSNFNNILDLNSISYTKAKGANRFRIRKFFHKNNEALIFADKLSNVLKIDVSRRLSSPDNRFNLLTAGSIHKGMSLLIKDNNTFKLDEVVSVDLKPYNKENYTIIAGDTSNYYYNDVLLHS